MTGSLLTSFQDSLERHDVGWRHIHSDEFDATLTDLILAPAVGAPLPFDGVSLAGIELQPTPNQLLEANTGVTGVSAGIADYGTLLIQSRSTGDEPTSLYPPRHIAILQESAIHPDVPSAIEWLAGEFKAGRDSVIFATGASATADMGELVYGVHGPREVHVVILSDL